MFKTITFLISVILIVNGCKIQSQLNKHRELINKFISAAQNYDTLKLYEIVDTTSYFKVQDKEGFLFLVNYVNGRFKICGNNIIDGSIKIEETPDVYKEYIVPFCRGTNGEIIYDSFDLLLTFTNDEMIRYIDVVKYRYNVTPTQPISDH